MLSLVKSRAGGGQAGLGWRRGLRQPLGLNGTRAAGFTLIELLIAMSIAVLIFTIGFTILQGTRVAQREAKSRILATEQARLFFEMVSRDVAMSYPGPFVDLNEKAELRKTFLGPAPYRGNVLQLTTRNIDYTDLQVGTFLDRYKDKTGIDLDLNSGLAISNIRYYVVLQPKDPLNIIANDTGFLYREVSLVQGPTNPATDPWPELNPPHDFRFAMFRGVNTLEIGYAEWDTAKKKMLGESDPSFSNIANADYLDVRITFLDPNEKLEFNKRKRSFYRFVPIPRAFTK